MKYSNINASIIEERNSILGAKEFVNSICNMITTRCSDEDLTRQIMSTSLGGGNKMLTEIIETNEELGTSNFNNIVSWKWTKAQLKVNEQRDNIDLLICELVKAIVNETSKTSVSLKTNETLKTNDYEDLEKIAQDLELDTECETNYLDNVDQHTLENYETYLAVKSFMYAVLGAFIVNIFVVYLNIK
jgi:hypothetical protein